MTDFFSKKQYATVDKELAIKLLNERYLECSIYAIFFNSSLIVSIKALFLSKILSAIPISEFFIVFNFSDKLYIIKKKVLIQNLPNISLVCT